jgi:hypothetical protein
MAWNGMTWKGMERLWKWFGMEMAWHGNGMERERAWQWHGKSNGMPWNDLKKA